MCRAICRTCVESSPAGGPSSHPTPGRGAGVPCTPQANAARPATAYLSYYVAEGRGVHRRPPARAARAASGRCRLTVLCRAGGRPRYRPGWAAQAGTRWGNSGPLTAARGPPARVASRPRTAPGRESGRRAGPAAAPQLAGPVVRKRPGRKLLATRSLRISGPEDKKVRSRAAPTGTGKQERGSSVRKTGAAAAESEPGRNRQAGTGGRPRQTRTRPPPADKNAAGPGDQEAAGPGRQEARGGFRRQERARRTRPPGPDRLNKARGPHESHGALREGN